MSGSRRPHSRSDLARIAGAVMVERGLQPEFPPAVEEQLRQLRAPDVDEDPGILDLRALCWCSIDNDDSRDLDQLSVSEVLPDGGVCLRVAVADVDALVPRDSPIDQHAWTNASSVYTSARMFPMLPERLSTDLSSLNPGQDRLALVTEMRLSPQAEVTEARVYRAQVHNKAQLAYDATSDWLVGAAALPPAATRVPGLEQQLRTQDEVAQRLRARRHAQGSLELETFEPRALFDEERVVDIREQVHNRARQLIEELMIATNECIARFLISTGEASLRRVVRSPDRWMRIVDVARRYGTRLPDTPSSQALGAFLAQRHQADPLRFPDLSLVIVKLMGPGEYVVERAGQAPIGHFGLAVQDYMHSTAPNRRYPDLITQRMVKAHLARQPQPYTLDELQALAVHCTLQEDAVRKVERRMRKSEAALVLESRKGQRFDAIVTGRTDSGTWVRIFSPPVEGRLVAGTEGLEVGLRLRVKLIFTDVEKGYVDFVRVG